jgi:hypothetical protein
MYFKTINFVNKCNTSNRVLTHSVRQAWGLGNVISIVRLCSACFVVFWFIVVPFWATSELDPTTCGWNTYAAQGLWYSGQTYPCLWHGVSEP